MAAASQARSQPVDPSVQAMLREGIAHRVAGRDEAALERFEAAWRARRAPVTAGQLALACQAVGRWLDADRYMREALASPDDDWVRRHRRELDEAFALVRRNVGVLLVRGGPAGAAVHIDGVEVGRLPLAAPVRVRAGSASLEVRVEGYFPLDRQVTVIGDELTVEPIEMRPVPRAEPVAVAPVPTEPPAATVQRAAPSAPPGRRIPAASWALGGVGAALLIGGTVALALREESAARFNNGSCPALSGVPRDAQPEGCRAELATGDWTTAATITGFAGGAVLVGVGVLLALLPPRRDDTRRAWVCAPQPAGLACAGTFQ